MWLSPKSFVLFVEFYNGFFSTSALISGIVSILGWISGESIFRVLLRVEWTRKDLQSCIQIDFSAPLYHISFAWGTRKHFPCKSCFFPQMNPSRLIFLETKMNIAQRQRSFYLETFQNHFFLRDADSSTQTWVLSTDPILAHTNNNSFKM